MDDRTKRESYVRNKYDIKWSLSLTVVAMLGSVTFWLMGIRELSGLLLLVALLFWLLWWGNCRTLNLEKKHLERKKDFGI